MEAKRLNDPELVVLSDIPPPIPAVLPQFSFEWTGRRDQWAYQGHRAQVLIAAQQQDTLKPRCCPNGCEPGSACNPRRCQCEAEAVKPHQSPPQKASRRLSNCRRCSMRAYLSADIGSRAIAKWTSATARFKPRAAESARFAFRVAPPPVLETLAPTEFASALDALAAVVMSVSATASARAAIANFAVPTGASISTNNYLGLLGDQSATNTSTATARRTVYVGPGAPLQSSGGASALR